MASISKSQLIKQAVTASVIGDAVTVNSKTKSFVGFLKVSSYVSGTFTAKIEHSPNGVDWFTFASFTAASAANIQLSYPAQDVCLNYVRANITAASTPNATLEVDLFFDEYR
jgi:hypothetical protein